MNNFDKNIDDIALRERVQSIQFEYSAEAWDQFESLHPEIEDKIEGENSINRQKIIKIFVAFAISLLGIFSVISLFNNEKNNEDAVEDTSNPAQAKQPTLPMDSVSEEVLHPKNKESKNSNAVKESNPTETKSSKKSTSKNEDLVDKEKQKEKESTDSKDKKKKKKKKKSKQNKKRKSKNNQ